MEKLILAITLALGTAAITNAQTWEHFKIGSSDFYNGDDGSSYTVHHFGGGNDVYNGYDARTDQNYSGYRGGRIHYHHWHRRQLTQPPMQGGGYWIH